MTFNINKQVGLFADFTNFYAIGQNIHVQLYGVFHAFGNTTRFTPFVFIGPGFVRDSNAGAVNYSFAWCTGAGLLIRLTRWVSFQTIPVEYVMNTANWNVGISNFVARAGFAQLARRWGRAWHQRNAAETAPATWRRISALLR